MTGTAQINGVEPSTLTVRVTIYPSEDCIAFPSELALRPTLGRFNPHHNEAYPIDCSEARRVGSEAEQQWMADMHVKLGRRGDYAVRISIDLARHWGGGPRKAREIALSMDIPTEFVKQILADLVAHGLLSSAAGPRGGYRLARPPDEVTLLAIIEAAEGDFGLQRCVLRGGPCDWTAACPVHEIWSNAQQAFADVLGASTLADLARIDENIEHGTYSGTGSQHIAEVVRRGNRS